MNQEREDDIKYVATTLRTYLVANPEAADTLEGISHWWLPAAVGADVIQGAVDRLVAEGTLRQMTEADGSVLYSGRGATNREGG